MTSPRCFRFPLTVLAATVVFTTVTFARAQWEEKLERGAYLVKAAGCADCHTAVRDRPFAGGLRLDATIGPGLNLTFYTPNISPDPLTGIGNWSLRDFRRALREGRSPNGSFYYPVFPWRSFTKITDVDVDAMFAYLKTLPPIISFNQRPDIGFPIYNQRWLMWFWKNVFFNPSDSKLVNLRTGPGPFVPIEGETARWNRGAYLVEGVLHCAECHTPRNFGGAPIATLWMAGSDQPVGKRYPPNITSDLATGLGYWRSVDWMRFLAAGTAPDGKQPAGVMALVIRNTARLTDEDRAAVVEYLMSLQAVSRKNKVLE